MYLYCESLPNEKRFVYNLNADGKVRMHGTLKIKQTFFRSNPVSVSPAVRDNVQRNGAVRLPKNAGLQPAAAMSAGRNNDTSVIRGPAIMKAGRLESYGADTLSAA